RLYSSSPGADEAAIKSILEKPTWSVRSLLPDSESKRETPTVSSGQLRHLLRLSALPQPSSEAEEAAMLETLESQIHFVREIQRVDTTGMEPLQSIRDESADATRENTIGWDHLQGAMAKERTVGRRRRIQRVERTKTDRPDGDAWNGDALAYASRTKGKFFDKYATRSETHAPSDRGQDLTTILDRSNRAELTILVAEIANFMRDRIVRNLSVQAPPARSSPSDMTTQTNVHQEKDISRTDPHSDPEERSDPEEETYPVNYDPEFTVHVLQYFDDWRDSVLLRIGEVVNKESEPDNGGKAVQEQYCDASLSRDPKGEDDVAKLHSVYPAVDTPLAQLPVQVKLLILHSMILLLLSLEHYSAHSRVLLLHLVSSLGLSLKDLNQDEIKIARGLLDVALELSSNPETKEVAKKSSSARKWKVGIASVAGAALIGITGGLAAPLVAAGLGTVIGGLGLGATAAAGYLGALAGSSVVVGGLFGAYGARMTGRMMDRYAREVEDFAFVPIRGSRIQLEDETEAARQDHRLRLTIGITGWATEEDNIVDPWRVVGADSEVFALRWELETLLNLGNAIRSLVTSAAWGVASREVLARTVFAQIMSAVALPLGLLKIARVVDNPFSVAKARADKAGAVLADALISKAQGERPVTLIGYSLGSRVIFSCLQTLAQRHAYGLIESAIFIGSPIPSDVKHWCLMRSVVSGRIVNVFSRNDSVLALLYRTSSLQLGVAGLQPVTDLPGVENIDASDTVSGHLRYQHMIGNLLGMIGLESLDCEALSREEVALLVEDRQEEQDRLRHEQEAGVENQEETIRRSLESEEWINAEADRAQ
ncbi:hypothetical protein ASPZODRAFT_50271, partial [Penicilliopsis zonata CBS 506.65]